MANVGAMAGVAWMWGTLWVCWLILAGSAEGAELIAATLVATGGTALAWRTSRLLPLDVRAPLRWWGKAPRIAWNVFRDSVAVLGCALGREVPEGRIYVLELGPPPAGASPSAAEAWLTASVSISPNTMVIGMDAHAGRAVVHQLRIAERRPVSEDLRRLW